MENKDKKYFCSKCGGDAYIGYSNWVKSEDGKTARIIPIGERWCRNCAKGKLEIQKNNII